MSTKVTGSPVVTQQQTLAQQKLQTKPKEKKITFFDSRWSGYQIAKLTGDNKFTDWLQDKDKICTDGVDDGKISFKEGAISFGKGLIGGIPKAIINHPVVTAAIVGVTSVVGAPIFGPLAAVGLVSGLGMAGYGAYKAANAKTDGEAKQALETCGMGVTTAATSAGALAKAIAAGKTYVKNDPYIKGLEERMSTKRSEIVVDRYDMAEYYGATAGERAAIAEYDGVFGPLKLWFRNTFSPSSKDISYQWHYDNSEAYYWENFGCNKSTYTSSGGGN